MTIWPFIGMISLDCLAAFVKCIAWKDDMIEDLKTDPALIDRLRASAAKPLTKAQLQRQRVSFVYGNLPDDSPVTRDQVAEKIISNQGK